MRVVDRTADARAIGIDIGGSRIKAGMVAGDGTLLARTSTPTPTRADDLYGAIAAVVDHLTGDGERVPVGLAIAGFVSADRTQIGYAPHLPWRDEPVAKILGDGLQRPVIIDHDVNCAAWLEHRLGAAAGSTASLTVALGTGIGAGLVTNGEIYRGSYGVAPELGHIAVVADGRACACGKRGCLERYCSGTALAVTANELSGEGEPYDTGLGVVAAARADDPVAVDAVADLARWLGFGLAIAADLFDPEVIVIAGGVSAAADLFLKRAAEIMAEQITGASHRQLPRVRPARFGGAASLVGAGLLALDETG